MASSGPGEPLASAWSSSRMSISGGLKACQVNLEIEVDERLQLDGQDLAVPASLLGEPVVGQHVGAFLGVREVRQPQGLDLIQPKELCGLDPTMAGNDLAGIVDKDRVSEAEALDAVSNLPDLLFRMGAGVGLVGGESAERYGLDAAVGEVEFGTRPSENGRGVRRMLSPPGVGVFIRRSRQQI
jgi:hypothetical protein